MKSKICLFLCLFVLVNNINGFVFNKEDQDKITKDLLDAFQHNIDSTRKILDQLMAKAVEQVDMQPLQPVFSAVGDNLNRISKAVSDLTAPASKKN